MKEVKDIHDKFGIDLKNCLIISNKAQLISPIHRLLDKLLEDSKGDKKIGSTLKGIGPTYQDKIGRHGLRVGDILSEFFINKYKVILFILDSSNLELLKMPNISSSCLSKIS